MTEHHDTVKVHLMGGQGARVLPIAKKTEAAWCNLLEALGLRPSPSLRRTAARAARLWRDELLAGERASPKEILSESRPTRAHGTVMVRRIGVHLVCPDHLTVAFGDTSLAYVPAGRIVGFGALSKLVQACTARLVLQEEAAQGIADALTEHLGARAAAVMIEAEHPCHRLRHPRAHRATVTTLAVSGDEDVSRRLASLLQPTGRQRREKARR